MIRYRKVFSYVALGMVAVVVGVLLANWKNAPKEDQLYYAAFQQHYGIYSPPIPSDLAFAGEPVPLHLWDVKERLDRELMVNTYWQSNMLLYLKRSGRWFPVIDPILKANGIPEEFRYLALIESGFLNVVSPAGAAGFWQILESTGRELGLEVNQYVDERFHPQKATEAASRFLRNARQRFGSWTLAAAAYNIGPARLGRILENQFQNCYYQLHLNEETARYIFRILAVKTIMDNPAHYGFHLRPTDFYQPIPQRTVSVDTAITNLAAFAVAQGTNFKTLRLLNPWLRSNELPLNPGKTYYISLPAR